MHVCVRLGTHEYSAREGQKEALDPSELAGQVVEKHQMWMLGSQLESSARATGIVSC